MFELYCCNQMFYLFQQQRTVYRLTLVKAWNVDELRAYSELVTLGRPDFIEVKVGLAVHNEHLFYTTMWAVPHEISNRLQVAQSSAAHLLYLCTNGRIAHFTANKPATNHSRHFIVHSWSCDMSQWVVYFESHDTYSTKVPIIIKCLPRCLCLSLFLCHIFWERSWAFHDVICHHCRTSTLLLFTVCYSNIVSLQRAAVVLACIPRIVPAMCSRRLAPRHRLPVNLHFILKTGQCCSHFKSLSSGFQSYTPKLQYCSWYWKIKMKYLQTSVK